MSKIKNIELDQYGAEPFKQQQFGTADIERVKIVVGSSLTVNYHMLSRTVHHAMCLLSDDTRQSVVILDTDVNNGEFTLSGLTADTNYTVSVAAVSVAGQSEPTVVVTVTTASDTLTVGHIVAIALVASLLVILASIGVCACLRFVCCLLRLS